MKKRKVRCKLKCILRKYTPKSSRLHGLRTHYKLWYVTYLHKCECFSVTFLKLNSVTASKLLQNNKRITSSSLNDHKIQNQPAVPKDTVSPRMKPLRSGDIELNLNGQTILSVGYTMLLNMRLRQLGLRPVVIGGEGDCFFQAVSHQLYGDPNHHLLI